MRSAGLALLLVACVETVDTPPPLDPASYTCTSCHGGADGSQPPVGVDDATDTSAIGVGAHAIHAKGGALEHPVGCKACHLVPVATNDPGHIDSPLPAEVVITPTTSASWDRATATCANSWCHGSFRPKWTQVDGTQAACGTCHGLPPPPPHPASDACEGCHQPVAGPRKTIADFAKHMDKNLDLGMGEASCAVGCHGSMFDPMPPPDLMGGSETTRVGVGAHAVHASGGAAGRPVACTACHAVPATVGAPGHTDTPAPAELVLASGTWDHGTATCASTSCHAGPGASAPAPVWTRVDGTQAACGSCHGFPPPAPHPGSMRCGSCHSNAGDGMTVDRATHVDGTVQF